MYKDFFSTSRLFLLAILLAGCGGISALWILKDDQLAQEQMLYHSHDGQHLYVVSQYRPQNTLAIEQLDLAGNRVGEQLISPADTTFRSRHILPTNQNHFFAISSTLAESLYVNVESGEFIKGLALDAFPSGAAVGLTGTLINSDNQLVFSASVRPQPDDADSAYGAIGLVNPDGTLAQLVSYPDLLQIKIHKPGNGDTLVAVGTYRDSVADQTGQISLVQRLTHQLQSLSQVDSPRPLYNGRVLTNHVITFQFVPIEGHYFHATDVNTGEYSPLPGWIPGEQVIAGRHGLYIVRQNTPNALDKMTLSVCRYGDDLSFHWCRNTRYPAEQGFKLTLDALDNVTLSTRTTVLSQNRTSINSNPTDDGVGGELIVTGQYSTYVRHELISADGNPALNITEPAYVERGVLERCGISYCIPEPEFIAGACELKASLMLASRQLVTLTRICGGDSNTERAINFWRR